VLRCPCGGLRRIHAIHSTRKAAEERLLQLGLRLAATVLRLAATVLRLAATVLRLAATVQSNIPLDRLDQKYRDRDGFFAKRRLRELSFSRFIWLTLA